MPTDSFREWLVSDIEKAALRNGALTTRGQVLAEALAKYDDMHLLPDPDYVYNPADWECTLRWSERNELVDTSIGDVQEFATLVTGPKNWSVYSRSNFGIHWFDTREESEAFAAEERKALNDAS